MHPNTRTSTLHTRTHSIRTEFRLMAAKKIMLLFSSLLYFHTIFFSSLRHPLCVRLLFALFLWVDQMKMHFVCIPISIHSLQHKYKNSIHINLSTIRCNAMDFLFECYIFFSSLLPSLHLLTQLRFALLHSFHLVLCAVLCCVDLTVKLINNAFEAIFLPPALFWLRLFIHSPLPWLNFIVYIHIYIVCSRIFSSFVNNMYVCVCE